LRISPLPLSSTPPLHRLRALFLAAADASVDPLFRLCYRRLRDRQQARDAVGETLIRAWNVIARGGPATDVRTLFFRIASGVIEEMRRGGTLAAKKTDDSITIHERSQLPTDEREALVMRFVDALETADTPGILCTSGSLIAARLRGGKRIFLSLTRYA